MTNNKQHVSDGAEERFKTAKYGKIRSARSNARATSVEIEKRKDSYPKRRKRKRPDKTPRFESPLKITFLGGLGEVGKNITLFEFKNDIIIVDCGISFPDASMLGIDSVIPDFTYVKQNAAKIKAVFITHGHEDHIGALPHLLKIANVPIYGSKLTIGLIEYKLQDAKMDCKKFNLNAIKPGNVVTAGNFSVEAIHVNHSIPDSLGFAVKCDDGTIVHTGDFKIDSTPIDGGMIDLTRFGTLGNEGVLCLLSDSTNSERSGFSESEKKVGASFESLFRRAGKRRLIVATFASNIHRVQQIINVASSLGRKVSLSGRSLESVVAISRELGYLNIPEGIIINIDDIKRYSDEELVIITTGSQGEPMSALARMAKSDHRKVSIGANDYVIISAKPIPGNEKTVANVINELMKLGAVVVYQSMYDVHVSGHACQEEQKLILGLVKPKFFIPVHGEQKHLFCHKALAESMGFRSENIILAQNGTEITFTSPNNYSIKRVPAGNVYVDGSGVGDVGSVVLKERKLLSEDGVIVIAAVIDASSGYYMSEPVIYSNGFVYVKESADLFNRAKEIATDILDKFSDTRRRDIMSLKNKLKDEISKFVYEKTKRRPVIIPIILEI